MIRPRVWIYSSMHNEMVRLPYWLRHYLTLSTKIIIYDDDSDDGSRELMLQAGVDVRDCPWNGINDTAHSSFASEQYKEARGKADWVMWVDGDEFIYHPHILERLEELTTMGVTLPFVDGFAMFADNPPSNHGQIYEEIRSGLFDNRYCKPVVINPDIDISWDPGKHEAFAPQPVIRDNDGKDHLKLLHYRWFNKEEHIERNAHNWSRISELNKQFNLGINCAPDSDFPHHTLSWYEQRSKEITEVV